MTCHLTNIFHVAILFENQIKMNKLLCGYANIPNHNFFFSTITSFTDDETSSFYESPSMLLASAVFEETFRKNIRIFIACNLPQSRCGEVTGRNENTDPTWRSLIY